jgi:hypothetical protein
VGGQSPLLLVELLLVELLLVELVELVELLELLLNPLPPPNPLLLLDEDELMLAAKP